MDRRIIFSESRDPGLLRCVAAHPTRRRSSPSCSVGGRLRHPALHRFEQTQFSDDRRRRAIAQP